jgi:hypothetical protein
MANRFENDRLAQAAQTLRSTNIKISLDDLSRIINQAIQDVSKIHFVAPEDLNVYAVDATSTGTSVGTPPKDLVQALESGTKFFDGVYYFSMTEALRPAVKANPAGVTKDENLVAVAKQYLFLQALHVMIRGDYGKSTGTAAGADVPAFLSQICGMRVSPAALSAGLCSFSIEKVPKGWIKGLQWSDMAQSVQQRLGLGLAGYRLLGPFKLFPCKQDASPEAKAAYEWVKALAGQPFDWALHSATRDPGLISKLGSFNKALTNLVLECFTPEQIAIMINPQVKILSVQPIRDPRANTWISWGNSAPLVLKDPIFKPVVNVPSTGSSSQGV